MKRDMWNSVKDAAVMSILMIILYHLQSKKKEVRSGGRKSGKANSVNCDSGL